MLCKARYVGPRDYNLRREIDCLQKISQAFPGGVAVLKLLGYVRHPRSGDILGFLREWVPSKDNLKDLKGGEGFPDLKEGIRWKVGRQIKETVKTHHGIEVIWGDAKPSNVVIDLSNDAWLVDFGGGWSKGWVHESLQALLVRQLAHGAAAGALVGTLPPLERLVRATAHTWEGDVREN